MVAMKPDYHYTKAKALLRRAEKDAHVITKTEEHRKLLELAQMHMAMYQALKVQQMPMVVPSNEPWHTSPYALYDSENTKQSPTGDVVANG